MTHTTNKHIQNAFNSYVKSNLYTLHDCYNSPSSAKISAFDECLRVMLDTARGRQPRIISYNTFMFTFGFIGYIDGADSFIYITPSKIQYIHLDEIDSLYNPETL